MRIISFTAVPRPINTTLVVTIPRTLADEHDIESGKPYDVILVLP